MSYPALSLPSPADTLPSPSDSAPLPSLHIRISPPTSSHTSPSHSPSSLRSSYFPSPPLAQLSMHNIPRLSIPKPRSTTISQRQSHQMGIMEPYSPSPAAAGPATPPCSPIEADNRSHLSFPLIASLLYTFPTGASLHPRTPSRNASCGRIGTHLSAGLGRA